MDLVPLIVNILGGAGGGAGAGALLKDKGLGMLGNLLSGGVGGLISGAGGMSLLNLIPDLAGTLGSVGSSLVGGGTNGLILTAILGLIKSKMK